MTAGARTDWIRRERRVAAASFLVAVTVHALVFWWSPPTLERAPVVAPGGAVLDVSLSSRAPADDRAAGRVADRTARPPADAVAPVPLQESRSTDAPVTDRTVVSTAQRLSVQRHVFPPASEPARTRTDDSPPPVKGEGGGEPILAGRILDAVRARFHYPWIARRRGWEGTVRVRLAVHPDGRLDHIQVVETSGFAVLDRAAQRTLARVGRIEVIDAARLSRTRELTVPIEYRLIEATGQS